LAHSSQPPKTPSGGDRAAARAGFEQVLAGDSLNVTALYRLAVLDGWDGQFSRSLERFARARRLDPSDEDIMVSEAAVLGWAGKVAACNALYDSVIARSPDRADALAGQARAVAWGGDLGRAERLWRAALDKHPDDAELLVGLAQTLYWRGRPGLAAPYAARARHLAPADSTAVKLDRDAHAALRPTFETATDGGGDSENNDGWSEEATYTAPLGADWHAALTGLWHRATLGATAGASYGADASVSAPLGQSTVLRAGLGGRQLNPSPGPVATLPTGELGVDVRLAHDGNASVEYAHAPFDETALLIARGLVTDGVDLSLEYSPSPSWSVSGTAGGTWLTDGNRRLSGTAAALVRVVHGVQVGPAVQVLSYRTDYDDGYFAPDRFTVVEGRLVGTAQPGGWSLRADAGVGAQQVVSGAAEQGEWHFGLTLSREWGSDNEIGLVAVITNSAAATSTTGLPSEAYRYQSIGLRFRRTL